MDFRFTDEELEFRDEFRAWLADHVPAGPWPHHDMHAAREYDLAWQRTLFDAGYAGISWPVEFGGRGASEIIEMISIQELAAAGAPDMGTRFVALGHGGPTLMAAGTPEQQQRHLGPILRGEHIWCQGFSEPGAGSDLAAIRTTGVIDGDHLVVNGQKIWCSYADVADFQELVLRTEPGSERHRGLSWVICDMKTPGIEVRPIMTLSKSAHFCEVFYDDVRVPLDNVVGGLGNGWGTAMTTLTFERGTAFLDEQVRLRARVEMLARVARSRSSDGSITDPTIARRLAHARADADALLAMSYRSISEIRRLGKPGPVASTVKLAMCTAITNVAELGMDVLGPDALWWGDDITHEWSRQWAFVFGGGTPEIQRNIVGERVLGLPR